MPADETADPCFNEDSQIFIQVGCIMSEADLVYKRELALIFGCAAVFISLFVINYLDFIGKTAENNYVEWDVKTITAGDYSIEFDLDPNFYPDWVTKELENWRAKCLAEGRTFKTP